MSNKDKTLLLIKNQYQYLSSEYGIKRIGLFGFIVKVVVGWAKAKRCSPKGGLLSHPVKKILVSKISKECDFLYF